MEDYKFLPDDFELIGDKQNIMIDEVAPSKPQWKDILDRFMENKGAVIGTRTEDSLIEQVHRAMLLYKSEDRALLLALIKNVAQDENGPFWRLLASLKELLPANDDLKQVEGLLQNAADLRESSKEKPREVIGDLFDTAR